MKPCFLRWILVWVVGCLLAGLTYANDLSGVINDYWPVVSVQWSECRTTVTVDGTPTLRPGDRVLVIQMKGASWNTVENERYGAITQAGAAGQWELATVRAVSGNSVILEEALLPTTNARERLQLVRVVTGTDATVSDVVTAQPWNGRTGGVVVIELTGTLRVTGIIDVSGLGFRGGHRTAGQVACGRLDLVLPAASPLGANKGEGVADEFLYEPKGRGAVTNGGGDGVSTNSGGGGGANYGSGGGGGSEWVGCGPPVRNGGVGGWSVRTGMAGHAIIAGGGGGAGHENNGESSSGAAGGGIIVILCSRLAGTGSLLADGANAEHAGIDGAGGGGAGGTIFLDAPVLASTIQVSARGGRGGNVTSVQSHGPGGGGGGGRILVAQQTTGISINAVAGGANGDVLLQPSEPLRSFYATAGEPGIVRTGVAVQRPGIAVPPSISAGADTVLCGTTLFTRTATVLRSTPPFEVVWRTLRGQVVSNGQTIAMPITPPMALVAEITDASGCKGLDTVLVDGAVPPPMRTDTIDLGPQVVCNSILDTTIGIRGANRDTVMIVAAEGLRSTTTLQTPLPLAVVPDSTARLHIRVVLDATGREEITATIEPCSTIVKALIRWTPIPFSVTVNPDTVRLGPLPQCTGSTVDTAISVAGTGLTGTIIDVLDYATADVQASLPQPLLPGQAVRLPLRIVATADAVRRVGIVVRSGECVDTIFTTIIVVVVPSTVTTDTLDLGVVPYCRLDSLRAERTRAVFRNVGTASARIDSIQAVGLDVQSGPVAGHVFLPGATAQWEVAILAEEPPARLRIWVDGCLQPVEWMLTWTLLPRAADRGDTLLDLGTRASCGETDTTVTVRYHAPVGTWVTVVDGNGLVLDKRQWTAADSTLVVNVRLSNTVMQRIVVMDSSMGCVDTLVVTIRGRLAGSTVTVNATFPGRLVLCPGDTLAGIIDVQGQGQSISLVRIDAIDGLTIPVTVPQFGQALRLPWRIEPGLARIVGTLRLHFVACDTVVEVPVDITVDSQEAAIQPDVVFEAGRLGTADSAARMLINTGTVPLTVGTIATVGGECRLQHASLPVTISPGDALPIMITWTRRTGAFRDTLTIGLIAPCAGQLSLTLRSDLRARTVVRLSNERASVGKNVDVAMTVDSMPDAEPDLLRRFQARVRVKERNVVVDADSVHGGASTDGTDHVVFVRGTWNGESVLARIAMVPLIGVADVVAVEFDGPDAFRWLDVESDVDTINGHLLLDDMCSVRRRFPLRFDGRLASIAVWPVPARDHMTVELPAAPDRPWDVYLCGTSGERLGDVVRVTEKTRTLDCSALPSGFVHMVCVAPGSIVTIPIAIVR
jgi:hypothetical protein